LQVVQQLRDARLQLTQRERRERFARFIIVIDVAQGIQRISCLAHIVRRLRHLLTKLGGFRFDALNFIKRFQRFRQILLDEFVLRREIFLLVQGIELRLNIGTRGNIIAVICAGPGSGAAAKKNSMQK
jgi:hypothetical protein